MTRKAAGDAPGTTPDGQQEPEAIPTPTPAPRLLWGVLRVADWEDIHLTPSVRAPFPIDLTPPREPGQPAAFLPLFETEQEALAWANGQSELVFALSITPKAPAP